MIKNMIAELNALLMRAGLSKENADLIESLIIIAIIIILAYIANKIARKIIVKSLSSYAKQTKTAWDDIFVQKKVFNRLAHIAPALVIYYSISYALEPAGIVNFIKLMTKIYMIIVTILVIDSFISALHEIYLTFPISREKPIKGYVQVTKIFIFFLGIIVLISILSQTPVLSLLAGLGAMAAVLLLVFKDTILGLVASIQVSANNMVKPGDWISMPSRGADGTVLEISLNTVKVQNWDKTISTFPTYALVTESFHNWKGMEESGGRRIKRSLNIDMRSVRFLDEKLKSELKKIQRVLPYIEERELEINKFNEEHHVDSSMPVNGRRMTNLGVFRKYMEAYLKQHPKIRNEMTFLIRHLQPTETGIPIEIYVFSKEQEWAKYESLQADIFDHVLASLSYFDLRVFQNPSGNDFQQFLKSQGELEKQ